MLPPIIQSHSKHLIELCRKHKVRALYVFGSALTSGFRADSDLDFLVAFTKVHLNDYADNFFEFRDALTQLFQREIDLVEVQTLKNPYFKKIVDDTKVQVYDGRPRAQMAV